MLSAARQPAWTRKLRRTGLRLRGYGGITAALVQRRELRYGSREFLAASDLARRLPHSAPAPALIRNLARRPGLLHRLGKVVEIAEWALLIGSLSALEANGPAPLLFGVTGLWK